MTDSSPLSEPGSIVIRRPFCCEVDRRLAITRYRASKGHSVGRRLGDGERRRAKNCLVAVEFLAADLPSSRLDVSIARTCGEMFFLATRKM
jgi:hypothetical protein